MKKRLLIVMLLSIFVLAIDITCAEVNLEEGYICMAQERSIYSYSGRESDSNCGGGILRIYYCSTDGIKKSDRQMYGNKVCDFCVEESGFRDNPINPTDRCVYPVLEKRAIPTSQEASGRYGYQVIIEEEYGTSKLYVFEDARDFYKGKDKPEEKEEPKEKDCNPDITGKKWDDAQKKCVEACPKEDEIWQQGKCINMYDEAFLEKDSCESVIFGADESEFNLAYDERKIKKELFKAIEDYKNNHGISRGSDKFTGFRPLNNLALGVHLARSGSTSFESEGQDELADKIRERYKQTNKKLKPGEVLTICLDLTDGKMYDALLTCHNTLRKDLRLARDNYVAGKQAYEAQMKNAKSMIDNPDSTLDQTMRAEKTLEEAEKKYEELMKAQELLDSLDEIRPGGDKTGAWYHLYGTTLAGFAQQENMKLAPGWARLWVFGEHVIAKPILLGQGYSSMDTVEYCWDRWGANIGVEMHDKVTE